MPTTAPLTIDLTEVYAKLDGIDTRLTRHDSQIDTATATVQGMLTRLDKLETPVPVPVPTPPNPDPFTQALSVWESRMELGLQFASAWPEYDGARSFYHAYAYTKDERYKVAAKQAVIAYRDGYLVPNKYGANGFTIYSKGLVMDYQVTGDEASRTAVLELAEKAAFANAPLGWLVDAANDAGGSREAAYNLETKLYAMRFDTKDRNIDGFAVLVHNHFNQWFVSETAAYVRPFMVGLSAEALIQFADNDSTVAVLTNALEKMWQSCWVESAGAMKYTDRVVPSGSDTPAADLNMLIAPAYAWLYAQTKEVKWRDRADALFIGGVQAYIGNAKQYNQGYRWAYDYLAWRQA